MQKTKTDVPNLYLFNCAFLMNGKPQNWTIGPHAETFQQAQWEADRIIRSQLRPKGATNIKLSIYADQIMMVEVWMAWCRFNQLDPKTTERPVFPAPMPPGWVSPLANAFDVLSEGGYNSPFVQAFTSARQMSRASQRGLHRKH